jgi:hypothetical protein
MVNWLNLIIRLVFIAFPCHRHIARLW